MNWHERYTQQARWTRDLRKYLFDKAGLGGAKHVLEAGCGTGAVLSSVETPASLHGLDISATILAEAGIHAPHAHLVQGDVHDLPYPDYAFDITFCHYLLLWVKDPLRAVQEMARVTRPGGNVLALAEPDYSQRVDKPASLSQLGKWQTEALRRQGADPTFGARLAETFRQAGIELVETGTIQGSEGDATAGEWELEWQVLKADLEDSIQGGELRKLKSLDRQARANGERALHVPTYFAWGRV
jgi:ubiquinone/menaquinone biosynthesis C-methylase UbiE